MSDVIAVLEERGNRYGTFEGNATLTQDLTNILRNHRRVIGKQDLPSVQQEALEMILHKISRIINGDPEYADNWVDICGYSQLVVDHLNEQTNLG